MKTITIQFDLDNDAFFNSEEQEVKRILLKLITRLECLNFKESETLPIKDINGNTIGSFILNIQD